MKHTIKLFCILLSAFVSAASIAQSNITYQVKQGETIYGISRTYNVSTEQLLKLNPELSQGLKAGATIKIPAQAGESVESNGDNIVFHKIEKGETLYGVSKKYNTTIESILTLNPAISYTNFKSGEIIRVVPNKIVNQDTTTTLATTNQEKDNNAAKEKPVEEIQNVNSKNELGAQEIHEIELATRPVHDTITVSFVFPFDLKSSEPSKIALQHTEFYKGFLMAVDSISSVSTKKIRILTYDNCSTIAGTDSVLRIPELKSSQLIFGPSNSDQLSKVNSFGKENNIFVFNAFAVHNDDYTENQNIIQGNIPPSYLKEQVLSYIDERFPKSHIVLLEFKSKHKDIYDEIVKHVKSTNHKITVIDAENDLSIEHLDKTLLPDDNYLFISSSATKASFQHILPSLKAFKDERLTCYVALLGYPEFVTYISSNSKDMHHIDTHIFSRFYCNMNDENAKDFDAKYKSWYGEEMRNAMPLMGVLGYDSGMALLDAFCNTDENFGTEMKQYNGIQTNYNFKRVSNWSGFINQNVIFLRFTPWGTIEKR